MSIEYNAATRRYRFQFKKTIRGETIRRSKLLPAGYTKAEAEAYDARQTLAIYQEYENPDGRVLISDAVLDYMKNHLSDCEDGYGIAKELERLRPFFEGRYLDELGKVGAEYRAAIGTTRKPATIRNKLSYLRAACRYAQASSTELVIDQSLGLRITMPKVENARQMYLSRAQMLKVCKFCPNRTARAVIRIAFYSGMRISETIRAGESLDAMKEKIGYSLRKTKNGSARIAGMHPKLWVLIKYFPLPYKKRWIQRLVRRAMDAAGFKEYTLHDLRHSTASALIKNGADLFTVGKVLGHKSLASTARYSHFDMGTINDAVMKIR
jgi:integrase